MDKEVVLDNKTYISTKRAAELTGYTHDYIGQLSREGRIDSRKIGRLRFVDKEGLLRYKREQQAPIIGIRPTYSSPTSFTYSSEAAPLLPELDKQREASVDVLTSEIEVQEEDEGTAIAIKRIEPVVKNNFQKYSEPISSAPISQRESHSNYFNSTQTNRVQKSNLIPQQSSTLSKRDVSYFIYDRSRRAEEVLRNEKAKRQGRGVAVLLFLLCASIPAALAFTNTSPHELVVRGEHVYQSLSGIFSDTDKIQHSDLAALDTEEIYEDSNSPSVASVILSSAEYLFDKTTDSISDLFSHEQGEEVPDRDVDKGHELRSEPSLPFDTLPTTLQDGSLFTEEVGEEADVADEEEVIEEMVCVGETCVTETELKELIERQEALESQPNALGSRGGMQPVIEQE